MADRHQRSLDADDEATWRQLRDRLREIRAWAEEHNQNQGLERFWSAELLKILNRPRERE